MLESTFRDLASNGAVVSVIIYQVDGGYTVEVKTITDLHILSLYRGGARFFKTIDAAAAVVKSCGFANVLVSWEQAPSEVTPKKQPPPASKRTPQHKKKRRK
ncbi:hypothetical protein [Aeromonas veronii]|uniref:hypothetical protein n=1 Tax=Aeromonas veronii TaxID=654 RepID=UPI001430CEB6|nr:hypothetical protein [Aeromonas veronii]NJI10798.1 hypothetical protein [Aeromonas veronii]